MRCFIVVPLLLLPRVAQVAAVCPLLFVHDRIYLPFIRV